MNDTQTWADLQDTGNAQAQLVLQAIARHADWETGESYPSRDRIAKMAKCSRRTVNRYIDKLETDGLIARVQRARENGSQTTNIYRLVGYAEWYQAVRNGGFVAKPKAVETYPDPGCQPDSPGGANLARGGCQSDTGGVTPVGTGGVTPVGTPITSLERKDEQTAHLSSEYGAAKVKCSGQSIDNSFERRGGQTDLPAPAAPAKWQLVTSGDPGWSQWMSWATESGIHNLRRAAESEGRLVVQYSRPRPGMAKPMLAPRDGSPKLTALLAARDARDSA